MSTNSRSVSGLEEMRNVVIEISQPNLRGQSSANITEIPNNFTQFRYTKLLINILTITSKIRSLDMLAQIAINFGLKKF